jgi:hypothetical protein
LCRLGFSTFNSNSLLLKYSVSLDQRCGWNLRVEPLN